MIRREDTPLIALAGNPNVGKTTLFNQLTGGNAHVGNYPGVTVEREIGRLELEGAISLRLMDVPGAYSLAAQSEDEQIALLAIAGIAPHEQPAAVILVVDATQLTRNLYLTLQVLELGLPTLIALNQCDALEETGQTVDAEALSTELGVPVVRTCANRGTGLAELRRALRDLVLEPQSGRSAAQWRPQPELAADIDAVAGVIPAAWGASEPGRARALALWALLSIDADDELAFVDPQLRAAVNERRGAALEAGREIDEEIIGGRYAWIDERADRFLRESPPKRSLTDRIDSVLLHRIFGFPIFLALMGVVFQSLFAWADPAIGWIEAGFEALGDVLRDVLPASWLTSLLLDGIIAGVGAVLVFLPQVLLLFFFLGLMEDTGYMARVASLMDRLMRSLGLHGRAFVPMLSGFACAIPAILATRTMNRRRDRMLTMMVVPLMTCSARLPVYTLLIATLAAPEAGKPFAQGLLMVAMYLFSTLIAFGAAAVLGRTLFRGPRIPLVIEMPPYRKPHWVSVMRMMWRKSSIFLHEAGTVILVCTIGMWLLLNHPMEPAAAAPLRAELSRLEALESPDAEQLSELERELDSVRLRESFGGQLGRAFEPVIAPLGFDWTIGVGILGAFAAREVFVSTMGVVYGTGADSDETSPGLRSKLQAQTRADGSRLYTPLVCLSLMVFFALACQCTSTLAVVKRETRSWRWPAFLFAYMTALAWIASFLVYQGGTLLGFA